MSLQNKTVYSKELGKGKIVFIYENSDYPLEIKFESGNIERFDLCGNCLSINSSSIDLKLNSRSKSDNSTRSTI